MNFEVIQEQANGWCGGYHCAKRQLFRGGTLAVTAIGIAEALMENRKQLAAALDVGTGISKPQHVTTIGDDVEIKPSEQRQKTKKRYRTGSPGDRKRKGLGEGIKERADTIRK